MEIKEMTIKTVLPTFILAIFLYYAAWFISCPLLVYCHFNKDFLNFIRMF